MATVQGTCDEDFATLRELLQQHLSSGEELGASVFVDIEGKAVVDLWGGYSDESRTRPWTVDTITNVWSTTKAVTSLAALLLVDRGVLDVHAKVATYWPEFAANGKQDIEVRHLLSHTSGVSGWDQPFDTVDMYDLEISTARLAAQAPWWEPGTASGYHAHNLGHLVGELVRRITGKSLKQFVAEEISGPLGADFQIGALESDWDRISDVIAPPPSNVDMSALDRESPAFKTFTGPRPNAEAANTAEWRRADLGALNGHGNARSVAHVLSTISLGGESNGVRLLTPETIGMIFTEQSSGVDLNLGVPLRFGIGYALTGARMIPSYLPGGRICFWGGWGGSVIVMDLDRHMTIAYVMNKMHDGVVGSPRTESYIRAVYDAFARRQEAVGA